MEQATHKTFPDFDRVVPPSGYAWWYVDGVSDDGNQAITMIAFVGSVFSPYYAWARRKAPADPLNHCALNVALYGRGANRWAMTERGRAGVSRSPDSLRIGPSSVTWQGDSLCFQIDERSAPLPTRIRGEVRVQPTRITNHEFILDSHGCHCWRPIAPCARIEVTLTNPQLQWSGHAYLDANAGTRPLEEDFDAWDWSRASEPEGTTILYEGSRRGGEPFCLALRADPQGGIETFNPPPGARLASTRYWRIGRGTRADPNTARVVSTLEDTPFYSRSLLNVAVDGKPLTTIHESLSMRRFRSSWVHCLLPFRMPRVRR